MLQHALPGVVRAPLSYKSCYHVGYALTCAEYETAITLTGFLREMGNPATGSWDDEGAGGEDDSVVE
uniref:hypothetical protein n=1 Tax=Streptomyces antimycoticus TaxID=68175 RepID=UPI002F91470C|nr:hypothetical protein OG546_49410 [Streptomyces antimycoticus]